MKSGFGSGFPTGTGGGSGGLFGLRVTGVPGSLGWFFAFFALLLIVVSPYSLRLPQSLL
jgi:hypothetical protein